MEQVNGTTQKKQVLFSIGSYGDRNSRVINKLTAASIFSSATLPHNNRSSESGTSRTRPVSLDFTDSAPRYRTLPNPKFKSIAEKFNNGPPPAMNNNDYSNGNKNIHINNNNEGEMRKEQVTDKPTCPPNTPSDVCVLMTPARNGPVEDKPAHPPKMTNRSISLEPDQLRNTGRVALTISAYEGEPRTPTRLDFLPSPRSSRQLSRSSSKASSSTDGGGTATPTPTPVEPEPPIQIGSRLQDELVATLKRSNLREKNDDTAAMENGEVHEVQVEHIPPPPPPPELENGSVKQLATELGKRITFRVNPETGEHCICDKKA